jgi:putative component of toxin-antitoxin plasmid stabilization module
MKLELVEIPGLPDSTEAVWKIRALEVNGRSLAAEALLKWAKSEPGDYKKIMKAMRMAVQQHRVKNPNHVKPCANPNYSGVYELRADKGHARLMFFYDDRKAMAVICTNEFFGKGSSAQQDTAFKHCHEFKKIYEKTHYENT